MTDAKPQLAVTYRSVESLIPDARNARTHSKAQVDQIVASIKEFGWTAPILIDGANGILAGHGRLAAARKLKMTEVPVIELSGLSDIDKRAYLIADNQLALDAGWDAETLSGELKDLKLADFDLGLVGFADADGLIAAGEPPQAKAPGNLGATNLQFNLIFESEDQRKVWFEFTRRLKGQFPAAETLGDRLARFLNEGGHVVAR